MTEPSAPLAIKLDRTVCDGFGFCARRAPQYFSLDDWGYASVVGDGVVAETDRDAVTRAMLDCPVHAIMELGEHRFDAALPSTPSGEDPARDLLTEENEADWGFTR